MHTVHCFRQLAFGKTNVVMENMLMEIGYFHEPERGVFVAVVRLNK